MSFDFGTANENQRKAIQATEGPVLVIAGPGTGKTFTLVKRAVYLITEKHVKPENIMIATFTEKAAKEIVTRITNELIKLNVNVNVNELYIGTLGKIIKTYNELLDEENALDFSSIQSIAYNLLVSKPDICKKIQDAIKYIMIDEYQDTNYVQEQLVFLIGKEHNNICVVGDDDQGLYRFRGATIRNILEFPDKFSNCEKITLSENYRSEKEVVNFYNEWMEHTQEHGFEWGNFRFDKHIVPAKENLIEGTPTVLKVGGNAETWHNNVLDFINKLKSSGKLSDYNQIAFLFRSVKQDRVKALADFLEQNGVPVYSPRSDLYFDRDEIKLIIGAMLACFPDFVRRLNSGEMRAAPHMRNYYVECV